MSVSTYDTNAGKWKQTWVDNTGSYLAFSGVFADGKMILTMPTQRAGKEVILRMVWQNITDDGFDWSWERSEDGDNWQVLWAIRYTRKLA